MLRDHRSSAPRGGSVTPAGCENSNVLDLQQFAEAVGRAHGEALGSAGPAATMVVVKGQLDERWKVEIEAEAQLD
jgi:hypothetical protein